MINTLDFSNNPSKFDHRVTKTQIVCTIGPPTNNKETLKALMKAGMTVARLNFSHGTHEYHASVIRNVREAAKELGRIVALMLDTKGPEIRSGKLKNNDKVFLEKGAEFTFTTDQNFLGDEKKVSTTYEQLCQTTKVGDKILVDDGLIQFRVIEVGKNEVKCKVLNSAWLGQVKGMNLPGARLMLPAVTEQDRLDIAFGVQQGIDLIAASFIRKAEDVREIRNLPGVREAGIKIISKIESEEGLRNFDEILKESDGIMVARGDLGVEIPIERVPIAQKMMITECNHAGKPVITATQMLESMIEFPRPTRAEATDVANAVYDGTDCVMLSGETAKGKYPVETVEIMSKICLEAEKQIEYRKLYTELRKHVIQKQKGKISVPESIASSAVKTSWDLKASLIIVLSDSGSTVRFVSKYRPHTPILCITSTAQTARQILISRGAIPYLVPDMKNSSKLIEEGINWALEKGIVKSGDIVVTTSGFIEAQSGSTNILKVAVVP
jgi:pyruvate kinase